jgi:hypothetical protein
MAARGLITPMPTAAVFADTQAEPPHIYEWLTWLQLHLPFEIHRVTKGSLLNDSLKTHVHQTTKVRYPARLLPVFYYANGQRNLAQRRCTERYKIEPIQRFTRQWLRKGVIQWMGISTDEASRMKPSRRKYIGHRWPLIELGMSRGDCIQWMLDNGYPAPKKSSCIFCPFHSDRHWLEMRTQDPRSFAAAADFERRLQAVDTKHGQPPFTPFLHRSLRPLGEAILTSDPQPNMFENDCSGHCGV